MNWISQRHLVLVGMLAFTAGTAGLAGAGLAQAGHTVHGGAADPLAMDAHLNAMFAKMVPDATPDQKARLNATAREIHADIGVIHVQFGQSHQHLHALLLEPVIDRAALEIMRAEQVRRIDAASKRIVNELADAAEILTPTQRAGVAAQLKGHAG